MRLTIRAVLSLTFPLLLASAPPVSPQSTGPGMRQSIQTRISELEGLVTAGANGDGVELLGELQRLRLRLAEGDFRPGDAIALWVLGDSTLSNTFLVAPPRHLRLPGMEPIELTGVLRDEIEDHLDGQLSRYLRNPEFTAVPLTRLAVMGGVRSPGFYLFRPDTPLLDVFSVAGGFAPHAKLNEVELRRFGESIVDSEQFRQAMAAGWDLQGLPYQPGDEIYVPAGTRPLNAREKMFIVSGVVGLTYTILRIVNVF